MSHTIFVFKKKGLFRKEVPAAQTLSKVPGLSFISSAGPAALAAGDEVLVACAGAARGVSVVLKNNGTAVRIFTAASRPDVDLAIQMVLALMADGSGKAINEDEEEFSSPDEIAERYDDDFREAYVTWGPGALAEQSLPEKSDVLLSGPWTEVTLTAAELQPLRDRYDDQAFAAAVLERVAARQAQARSLHQAFENPTPGAFTGDPHVIAQAVAAWIANQPNSADAASTWRLLSALPETVLVNHRLLPTALVVAAEAVPDATDPAVARLRALAVREASTDIGFAGALASGAHELAQAGLFVRALGLHDVVLALPPLATDMIQVQSGSRTIDVPAQASWVCNATWAAQADNNKLPVNPPRARAYLTQAASFGPANPPIYFNLACLAFEIGDHDQSLGMVSMAQKHGYPDMDTIASEPLLAPLRGHPRWADALAGKV